MEMELKEKSTDLNSEYCSLRSAVSKVSITSKKPKQADTKYFLIVLIPFLPEDKPMDRKEVFEFLKNHTFNMFIAVRGLCYYDNGTYLSYFELNENSRMRLGEERPIMKNGKRYSCNIVDKERIPVDLDLDTKDRNHYYFENPIKAKTKPFLKTYNFEDNDVSKFLTSMRIEKPNELCKYGKQYEDNFLKYFCQTKRDDSYFEYKFPDHMLKFITNPLNEMENKGKFKAWKTIKSWFDENCNMDQKRKKALIVYSKERCKGKTRFAFSLVNDQKENYIYNRGEIDGNEFKEKVPTGKLVILDDLRWDFKTRTEQYKALMSSEPVTIRSCYIQYFFDANIPCVILMNNEHVFKRMLKSDDFKFDAHFVLIKDYMGPPGTEPQNRDKIITNLSEDELEVITRS